MLRGASRTLVLSRIANCNAISAARSRWFCQMQAKPAVELTSTCIQRIKELEKQRQGNVVLRITVDGGGCSGFQYGFQLEDWDKRPKSNTLKNDDDVLFEEDGACVIIDNISLAYISGSKVDYEKELISSSFRVTENPNSESSCGCGVSFSPKQ